MLVELSERGGVVQSADRPALVMGDNIREDGPALVDLGVLVMLVVDFPEEFVEFLGVSIGGFDNEAIGGGEVLGLQDLVIEEVGVQNGQRAVRGVEIPQNPKVFLLFHILLFEIRPGFGVNISSQTRPEF